MSNDGVFNPHEQQAAPQGLDLSAVRSPRARAGQNAGASAPAGAAATGASGAGQGTQTSAPDGGATPTDPNTVAVPALVFDVTEQTFEAVVQLSTQVPVVIDLWAEWCGPCKQLSPIIEKVTNDLGGRLVLAKIDVDANPRLQQAFGVQSIPTVIALVKGQPVPLFQGASPEPQVRQVFDQLLAAAAQAGVSKRAVVAGQEPEPAGPKHAEAIEALEAGDLERAAQVYQTALNDAPGDVEAKQGLARVELLQRTRGKDLAEVRARAANNPTDVDAALECADLDVSGGHVEDAFARLLATLRAVGGEEKERVRVRLLQLFEAVGSDDPRVIKARGQLMRALF